MSTRATEEDAHEQAGPVTAQVMFALRQAELYLEEVAKDRRSHLALPYIVRTGEYIPYSLMKSHHLAAKGRYFEAPLRPANSDPDQDQEFTDYVFDWGARITDYALLVYL
jgi:hypothetical protein